MQNRPNFKTLPFNPKLIKADIDLPFHSSFAIPEPEPKKVKLEVKDVLNLFGRYEAMCIVYIPGLLTQFVIYFIERLREYCRQNRIADFKAHSRKLKEAVDEYESSLRKEMPFDVYNGFLKQRQDFLETCQRDISIMYFTFGNAIMAQHKKLANEDVYTFSNIICEIIRHIEAHDAESNRKIAERTNTSPRTNKDARLSYIYKISDGIRAGYAIKPTSNTDNAIKVIIQRAYKTVAEMM